MDNSLFDSINEITNSGFGSLHNPYEDPNKDLFKKIAESQDPTTPSAPAAPGTKPPATGVEIANKAADMFKQFGQAVGNKHMNIAAAPQISPTNMGNLPAAIPNVAAAPMPQISMPQMQVPQMQMGGGMQPIAPLPMAMSDYRTKTKIQDASIKIDALLDKVYENLISRK